MSEYTNTFGGAVQDRTSATILGANWDTEYANVATAIGTKTNKAVPAAVGNLAETATGDLVDSGIASTKLDGLSANVETRMDTIDAAVPAIFATDTGWRRAGNVYLWTDGETAPSTYSLSTNHLQNEWETYGATGAGMDNTWDALDELDGFNLGALILNIYIAVQGSGSGAAAEEEYYFAPASITTGPHDGGSIGARTYDDHIASGSWTIHEQIKQVIVPCDANGNFNVFRLSTGGAGQGGIMYLSGYILDNT